MSQAQAQGQTFVTVTPLDPDKFHYMDFKVECQRCRFSVLVDARGGPDAYTMAQYHSERCRGNAVAIKSARKQ